MKKIWKKALSVLLAACVALPLAACGGGGTGDGGAGNKVKIEVFFNRGGVQTSWFNDVEKRFEEATKNMPFGDKTGIDLSWKDDTVDPLHQASTAGTNIYMLGSTQLDKYVKDEEIMDISDVVNSVNHYDGKKIADKMDGPTRTYIYDGKYYGLPWKGYFMGITYNVDVFEKYDLYLADTSKATTAYNGNEGFGGKPCYFVAENPTAGKSAGLDGVPGTYDDGLPTSLEELMALCHKIVDCGWYPFACTGGQHEDYTNYLTEVILVGLEGAERFMNYSDCDGEMEIVVDYTSEKLWNLEDVYVPITETVTIDPNNKSTWVNISKSVARYYAIAFIKYLTAHDMICGCAKSSASQNITVQEEFIFSDTRYNNKRHNSAMIMEGSYWYTESEHNGNFTKWNNYMKEERPEFGIMPYVVSVDGSNTDIVPTLCYMESYSNVVINNNLTKDLDNNKYVIEACKEFLYFFYSDQEIANYIEATGQNRLKSKYDWQQLVYEKDENGNYQNGLNDTQRVIKADCKLSNYQITVLELERDAKSDNKLLNMEPTDVNPTAFLRIDNVSSLMKTQGGVFFTVFKSDKAHERKTVRQAFEETFVQAP